MTNEFDNYLNGLFCITLPSLLSRQERYLLNLFFKLTYEQQEDMIKGIKKTIEDSEFRAEENTVLKAFGTYSKLEAPQIDPRALPFWKGFVEKCIKERKSSIFKIAQD